VSLAIVGSSIWVLPVVGWADPWDAAPRGNPAALQLWSNCTSACAGVCLWGWCTCASAVEWIAGCTGRMRLGSTASAVCPPVDQQATGRHGATGSGCSWGWRKQVRCSSDGGAESTWGHKDDVGRWGDGRPAHKDDGHNVAGEVMEVPGEGGVFLGKQKCLQSLPADPAIYLQALQCPMAHVTTAECWCKVRDH